MKPYFVFTFVIIMALVLTACSTTIPVTDNTPPRFSFQIRGDGFSHTFDQDTDFSSFQLNLKDGAVYNFTLTGADDGGVSLIRWQFAGDYLEFQEPVESPWVVTDLTELTRRVEFTGDRSAPLTANVLTGRFRIKGNRIGDSLTSVAYNFWVRDFGGQSGTENTFSAELNIQIDDHETEIVEF